MKRVKHEEHVNTEAWVIPYADLLTLLLALFVVLYAMSSVNTTKYRALAQAISAGFNGTHDVIHPLQPATPTTSLAVPTTRPTPTPRSPLAQILLPLPAQRVVTPINSQNGSSARNAFNSEPANNNSEQANLDRIRSEVEHALQPLIDKKLVVVRRTPNWLEIEIRTDILFPSGVATLSPSANEVLMTIGKILAPFGNPLRVEGYTDDVPINTSLYPSNWELSAARAASVARLFADHGVDPERLGIVGWGQYRPASDNESVDGRNRNRRVLVVVLSDRATPARFYTNSDQVRNTADADNGTTDDVASGPATSSTAVTAPVAVVASSTIAMAAAPVSKPASNAPAVETATPAVVAPMSDHEQAPVATAIVTPSVDASTPHLFVPANKG